MAIGLQYLHTRNPAIVHGDLKLVAYFHNSSDNCSISQHNVLVSDKGAAQLCDFGLSLMANDLSKNKQSTMTLGFTTRYSSLEVLDNGMKMVKSDIYTFACM